MKNRLAELLACAVVLGVTGCGNVLVQPQAELPPPLIDSLPVTIGVHYPEEFRSYAHKETRYQLDYEIDLGPAHVIKLTRLLAAMFDKVIEVDDPTRALEVDPDIVFVLEPRFEDYAFLTPRDMVGESYTVTIRYRVDLYDPRGERVDAYVFTGFGRQKSGNFSGTEPLLRATQRAMRDAGAKLAVELPEQESVRRLIAGEVVKPQQEEQDSGREALGSFGGGSGPQGRGPVELPADETTLTTPGGDEQVAPSAEPPDVNAAPVPQAESAPPGPADGSE